MGSATDRYFADATAGQLRAAANACDAAAKFGVDDDWGHHAAAEARRLTEELGWSWDFTTWSHAAGVLEAEAALAEGEG